MAESHPTTLGRYRIVSEIGRGNMGVVYKAEDPELDRTVAIKTINLSADIEDRAEYEARFRQEARAAGGWNHPNLVTVYDVHREGDIAFMAMELLDGTELRDLMNDGRLPLLKALDIVAQVADGLAFVHGYGIVHRDIKPGNIMVMLDGRAKIMDFGIARMLVSDIQTQAGTILGSPKYMSPEQVTSQRTDHRSDIFSLGVVLYELVAGVAPFSAKNVGALMQALVTATPRPPSELDASLPLVLDFIVARALQKEPDARYQSAAELAADLRACRARLPGQRPSESTVRIDLDITTTVRLDAAAIEAAAREIAQSTVKSSTVRAGELASHLTLSRRFDSRAAYERLMQASITDAAQATLPPVGGRPAWNRWLYQPERWALAAALATAGVAAVAIALG
jgi:eukaryotic-like serine/threonine-protein kinase